MENKIVLIFLKLKIKRIRKYVWSETKSFQSFFETIMQSMFDFDFKNKINIEDYSCLNDINSKAKIFNPI
jgi:hypothetical protein